jgi:hypothetical protein
MKSKLSIAITAVLLIGSACTGGDPVAGGRLDAGYTGIADEDAGPGDAGHGEDAEMQPSPPPDAFAPRFVDAQAYFQEPEEIDAWYALMARLRREFDEVCGDTFCEGEFSNYQSLRFRCSVEVSTGTVGRCVWVLAASNEEIAPATGAIEVDGRASGCRMPVAPETDVRALVQVLSTSSDQAIRTPLPRSDLSLYDGLAECL